MKDKLLPATFIRCCHGLSGLARIVSPATWSDIMPTPFSIAVPDADIADLRARLVATRFPATLEGVGWAYGTEDAFLRRFVDYWANQYDWRAAEQRLNGFPQFIEEIDASLKKML